MSAKARDGQGRWRCKTIGVRVSPEENVEIDALAALFSMYSVASLYISIWIKPRITWSLLVKS